MSDYPLSDDHLRTQSYFDANSTFWHDVYDDATTFAGYRAQAQHQFVLSFLRNRPNIQHVLELGCGAGRLAIDLAAQGNHVTALDIAPQMIARAQQSADEHGVAVDWRVGLAENVQAPNASYDAVVALGLLANVPNLEQALAESQRVLRPGGLLLTTMPNPFALDVLLALPRSLPIIIWHPGFRRFVCRAGNVLRKLRGRDLRDPRAIRFGRTTATPLVWRQLRRRGFDDITLHALAFGPMMPLGQRRFSDEQLIRWSKKLVEAAERRPLLRHSGSLLIYTASKR